MASNFFKSLPRIDYNFSINGKIESHNMVYIHVKYKLSSDVVKNSGQFYQFPWQPSMRPDTFAETYYGSDSMYWLALFSMGVYDVHNELPRTDDKLAEYMYLKYKDTPEFIQWCNSRGITNPQMNIIYSYMQEIAEYRDSDGDVVDITSIGKPGIDIKFSDLTPISIGEKELEENDRKSNVNIVDNRYTMRFRSEFDTMMNSIKADMKYTG